MLAYDDMAATIQDRIDQIRAAPMPAAIRDMLIATNEQQLLLVEMVRGQAELFELLKAMADKIRALEQRSPAPLG